MSSIFLNNTINFHYMEVVNADITAANVGAPALLGIVDGMADNTILVNTTNAVLQLLVVNPDKRDNPNQDAITWLKLLPNRQLDLMSYTRPLIQIPSGTKIFAYPLSAVSSGQLACYYWGV